MRFQGLIVIPMHKRINLYSASPAYVGNVKTVFNERCKISDAISNETFKYKLFPSSRQNGRLK